MATARIDGFLAEETASEIAFGALAFLDAHGLVIPECHREQVVNALAGIARKEIGSLFVERRVLALLFFRAAGDDGIN